MAEPIDWDIVAQRIALQSGYDPTLVEGVTLDNLEDRLGQTAEEIKTKATEIVDNPDITYSGLNLMTDQELETGDETPLTDAEKCVLKGGTWDGTSCIMPDDSGADDGGGEQLRIINQMKDAFQLAMRNMGFSKVMIDDLFEWAKTKFESDPGFTAERALMEMYDHPVFVARFPAIDKMRKSGMKNIPTPGEYIAYEKFIGEEFRRFSFNVGGDVFNTLVERLIINQVGEIEVTERLSEGERVLYDVPQEVRDTFNDWWGDGASKDITMQLLLDPQENWSNLKDRIETAEVGAWGRMAAGLDEGWDQFSANRIADLGLSQAATWNAFASLKDKELLFAEQVGEDADLQYETHGISAEFGVDMTTPILTGDLIGRNAVELEDMLERRKQRRISRFAGGGTGQAGAIISGQTTGIGSANA